MSSCSSGEPAQAKEWQQDYCAKLGSWQDARHATAADATDAGGGDGESARAPESDSLGTAGTLAIAAAKRLAGEGLEHGGGHILDDTVYAVGGDTGAERRAVSYCDSSGFETLVDSAG
ncbi:hypothetical protein ACFV5G_37825 [Streptomyces sp. NPDC059766]|uniref:hypothetical protein n=1 Tax=Streptomyces sp. NPDC059766 TaxID=3346940 RepID=UPI00365303CB